jgi:uncharacterized DUF497 family protein
VTFDDAKSERNQAERGLPFHLAGAFEWSCALVLQDTRRDYGEQRFQAIGFIEQHLHVLVFTPRADALHVISLRRANRRERSRYAANTQT